MKKPLAFVEPLKKPRMTLSINGLSKYDATYHYQAAPKYNKAMPVTPISLAGRHSGPMLLNLSHL